MKVRQSLVLPLDLQPHFKIVMKELVKYPPSFNIMKGVSETILQPRNITQMTKADHPKRYLNLRHRPVQMKMDAYPNSVVPNLSPKMSLSMTKKTKIQIWNCRRSVPKEHQMVKVKTQLHMSIETQHKQISLIRAKMDRHIAPCLWWTECHQGQSQLWMLLIGKTKDGQKPQWILQISIGTLRI